MWRPKGKQSSLRYEFIVNHQRSSGSYDSYITQNWALFRGDKLAPSTRVTAAQATCVSHHPRTQSPPRAGLPSRRTLPHGEQRYRIDDPKRRFDEPAGWMLVGKIGVRSERIEHVNAVIAAPEGDSARRQDALAFINWNLPQTAGSVSAVSQARADRFRRRSHVARRAVWPGLDLPALGASADQREPHQPVVA